MNQTHLRHICIEHLATGRFFLPGSATCQEASIRRMIAERMARQILEAKNDNNIDETDVSCILNLGQMFRSSPRCHEGLLWTSWRYPQKNR